MGVMGYKEIGLISAMSLPLAYILPVEFFVFFQILVSFFLWYQTFQDHQIKQTTHKIGLSLILLTSSMIISIFIFYKPVLALFALVFYVVQLGIYLFNDHKFSVETNLMTTNEPKNEAQAENREDLQVFIQSEVKNQLSKIEDASKRERVAIEKIERYKKQMSQMEKRIEIQNNSSNNEIKQLRQEKEKYQKLTDQAKQEAIKIQNETIKLRQKMGQKNLEMTQKEQKAIENIKEYKNEMANIENELFTHKNISDTRIEALSKEKKEYQKLSEEVQKNNVEAQKKANEALSVMQQQLYEKTEKEKQFQKDKTDFEKRLAEKNKELKSQNDKSTKEIEKAKQDMKEYEKLAEESEQEKNIAQQEKDKAQKENEQIIGKLSSIEEELEKTKKINVQKENRSTKLLEQRWKRAFVKLEFAPGVIKDVNKKFEENEFGNIEQILVDISTINDPHTLKNNRGKMKNSDEDDHIGFLTPSGFQCRIFYNVKKRKKVLITQIVKHNDPRYGKVKKSK